jgi:hypothetical protein
MRNVGASDQVHLQHAVIFLSLLRRGQAVHSLQFGMIARFVLSGYRNNGQSGNRRCCHGSQAIANRAMSAVILSSNASEVFE